MVGFVVDLTGRYYFAKRLSGSQPIHQQQRDLGERKTEALEVLKLCKYLQLVANFATQTI